jgi:3-methyladenine DNA glycosylase AlkD
MNPIISTIRAELVAGADDETRASAHRFFKEEIKVYGVKSAGVRRIAGKYWKEVATLDKGDIFALCEELFRSDVCEDAFVVAEWLPRMAKRFEPGDLAVFEGWITRYINNWAKCDSFCNHTVGDFILMYPQCLPQIVGWAGSDNRWVKRAAAVSLILPARKGNFLPEVFEIADRLLTDGDDMVQKGYGWLLKESSRLHQDEVFDYVVRHRRVMPRTALRYAVELMPKDKKAEAMKRE